MADKDEATVNSVPRLLISRRWYWRLQPPQPGRSGKNMRTRGAIQGVTLKFAGCCLRSPKRG